MQADKSVSVADADSRKIMRPQQETLSEAKLGGAGRVNNEVSHKC